MDHQRSLFGVVFTVLYLTSLVSCLNFKVPVVEDEQKHSNVNIVSNTFPAEGMYVTIRNDALNQILSVISLQIADEANTYTSMPAYSGETDSATYTFSNFNFDIDLEQPYLSGDSSSLVAGWKYFQFMIVFNFHVCAKSWPNPCDNGWAQVYSTDSSVSLTTDLSLDLTGPTVKLVSDKVTLGFDQNGIDIYVQCTSTFCLVPVSDIAQGIASNFVTVFQDGLTTAIQTAANSYINTIATSYSIPSLNVALEFQGDFSLWPASNPNLVLYANGYFEPDQSIQPPFTPTTSPPDTVFASPPGQLNFIFTDYLIRTAIWAMDVSGDLNYNITDADLPSTSPVHLNTNDVPMQSAVPGLKDYPNMNIVVQLSLVNVSSVDVTGNPGINIVNTLKADFILTNSTLTTFGFELLLDIGFIAKISTVMNGTEIQVTPSFTGFTVSVQETKSAVGPVATQFFQGVLTLALNMDSPNLVESFLIPTPQGFTVGTPAYSEGQGYGVLSSTLTYNLDVPVNVCGSNEHTCPSQTTCCTNSDSSYFCCTMPSANCCGDGSCCPQGWSCDQGECVGNANSIVANSLISF